ncbi:beta strand repeat-containing protein [Chitinilyticum litopenaei]|uniref:beta strand repeat-containing protein n=1 Tax=Chitinilyticum litopenaei TaxID=1121276 RepID=UPI000402F7F0|nr:DUF4214 domain-containing protein [Chitinilyticum litopenaei]
MASAASLANVQKLYIAYYARPADALGLEYWAGQADANGVSSIVNAFASSEESKALFAGQTVAQQITSVYQNAFNRDPDLAGLNYYVAEVAAGRLTVGQVAFAVLEGAQGADQAELDAKLAVADAFSTALNTVDGINGYTSNEDAVAARQFLDGVTAANKDAKLTEVPSVTDAIINNASNNTFVLTNGTDKATANVFEAGLVYTPGGDDRINSLQDEDVLSGTGTNATLNATLGNANDNGANIITPALSNIETINVAFSGSGADAVKGLDLQDATGQKEVNVTRVSQSINEAEIGNITTVASKLSLANTNANQAGTVEFSYAAGVLKGDNTADLTLSNVQIGTLNLGENTSGIGGRGVSVNGFESLNLESTGAANTVGSLNLPADTGTAGELKITGDKDLTLAKTNNVINRTTEKVEAEEYTGGVLQASGRLAKIDASDFEGSLKLNLGNNILSQGKADTSGVAQNVTVIGSKQADTFYLNDTVQAGDSIDGGDGEDSLVVLGGGVAGTVSKVENVDIKANNAAVAIDFSKIADAKLTSVRNISNIDGAGLDTRKDLATSYDAVVTLTKLTVDQAKNITVLHGVTGNNDISDLTLSAALATDTASDELGITIGEGTNTDERFNFTLAAAKFENLTISNADSESNTVELANAADLKGKLVLKGGVAGTFINFDTDTAAADDANVGLWRKAIGDGANATNDNKKVGVVTLGQEDVGSLATAVRLVAAEIDASAEVSDVIVRVSTTEANTSGGQKITMGAGNDTVIFDQLTGENASKAGLTVKDTVVGGAGDDTLVIDGDNLDIQIQKSEWDNVSGFETLYLAGNGAGKAYFLEIDDDFIKANNKAGRLKIDNDDDSSINGAAGTSNAAKNTDDDIDNTALTLFGTKLSASTYFEYDGEEGTGSTVDRFVLNDNNVNGGHIIDGGEVDLVNDKTNAEWSAVDNQSKDVIEVREEATFGLGDLDNIKNVGKLVINNTAGATPIYLDVSLNNTVADALSDAGHTASLSQVERLDIIADEGTYRTETGTNQATATAGSGLKIKAKDLGGQFQLNVKGDQDSNVSDSVEMTLNIGGATQIIDLDGTDFANANTLAWTAAGFDVAAGGNKLIINGYDATKHTIDVTDIGGKASIKFTDTSSNSQVFTLNDATGTIADSSTVVGLVNAAGVTHYYTGDAVTLSHIVGTSAADALGTIAAGVTVVGGAGADTYTLGAAAQTVVFNSTTGADTITGYAIADDSIQLSKSVFTALTTAAGGLTAGEFVNVANAAALAGGSVAAATNAQQIIFVADTGSLYYNADGATAGGLTLIGVLGTGLGAMAETEFTVIA